MSKYPRNNDAAFYRVIGLLALFIGLGLLHLSTMSPSTSAWLGYGLLGLVSLIASIACMLVSFYPSVEAEFDRFFGSD